MAGRSGAGNRDQLRVQAARPASCAAQTMPMWVRRGLNGCRYRLGARVRTGSGSARKNQSIFAAAGSARVTQTARR